MYNAWTHMRLCVRCITPDFRRFEFSDRADMLRLVSTNHQAGRLPLPLTSAENYHFRQHKSKKILPISLLDMRPTLPLLSAPSTSPCRQVRPDTVRMRQ